MKKFVLFLFFACFIFCLSFAAARLRDMQKLSPKKVSYLGASPYVLKNHPFTLVLVGYNNGASVAKTLSSIFSQNYSNYRLIYIDDHSDDGSFDLVSDLVNDSGHLLEVTLVRNEQRLGELANIVRAVKSCSDEEIVVLLHVDDWLAHEWVLQRLNAYYADPDLWMALSQYCTFPSYEKGSEIDLRVGNYRKAVEAGPHLKSFYASLFKKIRESDFTAGGKFFNCQALLAYLLPMLEMSRDHSAFIPEVFTINNLRAPLSDEWELQVRLEKFIRTLAPYPALSALRYSSCSD